MPVTPVCGHPRYHSLPPCHRPGSLAPALPVACRTVFSTTRLGHRLWMPTIPAGDWVLATWQGLSLGRSRPKKLGPSWRVPLAFQVASVGSIRHWQTVTIQVPSQDATDLLVMKPDVHCITAEQVSDGAHRSHQELHRSSTRLEGKIAIASEVWTLQRTPPSFDSSIMTCTGLRARAAGLRENSGCGPGLLGVSGDLKRSSLMAVTVPT
jgi:hypothetical protein